MHATEALAKRAVQERSSFTKGAKVVVDDGSCDLECRISNINQAQLDSLCVLLHIPTEILMRVLAHDELFHNARDDVNEIPFLMAPFKCGVRLSFIPLLRQFLSEMPLHPLQVSSALWENLLGLSIIWHKAHAQPPSLKELQACFGLRSPCKTSGSYYSYNI